MFFEISRESADLWYCSFDLNQTHIPYYLTLLSSDEILKAKRFKFEIDRERFIISRGILRVLLGRYLKENPKEIEFEYSSYGKPFVLHNDNIKFNISHSGNMAVFGFVKDVEIGVDIEKIKEDFDVLKLAKSFFSKDEIVALEKQPKEELSRTFFRCWTRKESFIKAEGSGLSFPLDKFSVSMDTDDDAELLKTDWDFSEKLNWNLFPFTPATQYIGALAVRNKLTKVSYFDWDVLNAYQTYFK